MRAHCCALNFIFQGLLPVSYRNSTTNDTFPTAYEQLVDHLPVVLDLTIQGFEGGPRTGSAKVRRGTARVQCLLLVHNEDRETL